jgi:predicted Zn-dependent protease
MKALQQAVSLDPNALSARAALGKRLLEAGNAAQAIPHLEAAKSLDAKILFQLSQAYKSTGKVALSRQNLAEYQKLMRKRSEADATVPEITKP